ncbi:MAG: hypothetical protein K5695_16280 [Oscillospiraceae bacterium]|nr:hypothetical protein [Oscillospiraceae bacterium]
MKINLNLDPLKIGPFELDLVNKVKSSDLAERVKAAPAAVADKVKESQVGPICIAATIGFLSGVAIGLVLSPVKNGINILSNNDFHTEESEETKQKKEKEKSAKKACFFTKRAKKFDYPATADEDEEELSV